MELPILRRILCEDLAFDSLDLKTTGASILANVVLKNQFRYPVSASAFEATLRISPINYIASPEQDFNLPELSYRNHSFGDIFVSLENSIFRPNIDVLLPPPFNYITDFFYYLITNEATRIIFRLREVVSQLNEEKRRELIRSLVEKVEEYIKQVNLQLEIVDLQHQGPPAYSEPAKEQNEALHQRAHYVLYVLQHSLLRIYLEIQALYPKHHPGLYQSLENTYRNLLGKEPPVKPVIGPSVPILEYQLNNLLTTKYERKKALHFLDKVKRALKLLEDYQTSSSKVVQQNALFEFLRRIENYVLLKELKNEVPKNFRRPTVKILGTDEYTEDLVSKLKERIVQQLDKLQLGVDRFEAVNELVDQLEFLETTEHADVPPQYHSAPRKLSKWLGQKKAVYQDNLQIDFKKLEQLHALPIETKFTVGELAYLFRLLCDEDLVERKKGSYEELYKTIAATFRSREGKGPISQRSFKNLFNDPPSNSIDFWIGKFQHFIVKAKKDK